MLPMTVLGVQIEGTTGAPVVLLQEEAEPHRVLPIFVGGLEARAILLGLTGEISPRPMTHDLMGSILDTAGLTLDRVEVTDMDEGTYLAELVLHGAQGEQHIPSRPSDAIALAVRLNRPVFADEHVVSEAGLELIDEAPGIEDEVDRFRDFLDTVQPDEF